MPGNSARMRSAGMYERRSRYTFDTPRFRISEWMLRATTSRGARSFHSGIVALHERRAALVHEPRARAAHRLGDQEARRIAVVERGRVELHVLGVDHAGAGAVRHGEAVAARAHRVGGAQEDLAEPAGGQDGGAGEAADDLARRLVEHVGADAGQRVVDGAAVAAVVRRCEQVDGRVAGEETHARVARERGDQRVLDGAAGGVGGVQDARQRVPALAAERETAVGPAVEGHVQPVEQDRLHQPRPALRAQERPPGRGTGRRRRA